MSYDVFFYVLMFVKRLLNGKMFWRGEKFEDFFEIYG